MRLLVTRPEPDGEETAARLRALGHEATVDPMLRIVFATPPEDLAPPAAIVVTSRNGVRALAAWPMAGAWRAKPLFVTGEATAEIARAAGFTDVRPGAGDAAGLAELIVGDLGRRDGPILYLAARDRSGDLAGRLAASGLAVRTVEAYRAEAATGLDPAVAEALRAGRIDGVLFFSRRTAEAFAGLVEQAGLAGAMRGLVFYAFSERIAEPLRRFGDVPISIAERPDFDALAALIVDKGS